jgi:hypothetical protein
MQAVRHVIDLLTGELRAELYATARRLIVEATDAMTPAASNEFEQAMKALK